MTKGEKLHPGQMGGSPFIYLLEQTSHTLPASISLDLHASEPPPPIFHSCFPVHPSPPGNVFPRPVISS